jgi:hypothetical protein
MYSIHIREKPPRRIGEVVCWDLLLEQTFESDVPGTGMVVNLCGSFGFENVSETLLSLGD